jgi:hypothetical protein
MRAGWSACRLLGIEAARGRSNEKEDEMKFRTSFGIAVAAAALMSGPASAVNGHTEQGLRADGLRWQATADRYVQLRGTTPQGLKADGLRYQAMARFYDRPAASYYTPAALEADGLRWQAMARFYAEPAAVGSGFDWGAAAIGGAGTFVVLLSAGVLALGIRKVRQEKLAV